MEGTFKKLNLKVPAAPVDYNFEQLRDTSAPEPLPLRCMSLQDSDQQDKERKGLTTATLNLFTQGFPISSRSGGCSELGNENPGGPAEAGFWPSKGVGMQMGLSGSPRFTDSSLLDRNHQKRQTSVSEHSGVDLPRKSLRTGGGDGGKGDACSPRAEMGWRPTRDIGGGLGGGELRRAASGELKRTSSGDFRRSPRADLRETAGGQPKLRKLPSAVLNLGGGGRKAVGNEGGDRIRVEHEGSRSPPSGPLPDEPVVCRVACQTRPGRKNGLRKLNQDAYCFMRSDDRKCLLFGVFDGHGPNGQEVALYVKEHLPTWLMKQPNLLTCPGDAFASAFSLVDQNLEPDVECSVSGTTAVVAQIFGRMLTVAWAGDSRAVLACLRPDGTTLEAVPLTVDHKPDNAGEKQRIMENDGRVDRLLDQHGEEVGPYRVWLRESPFLGLAMSRSLGDCLAHSVGVISHPEVSSHELQESDKFLILASDGIWEWISSEEAVEIVGLSSSTEAGCKKLMQTARARWQGFDHGSYVDDMTAMVIGFTHRQLPSQPPSIEKLPPSDSRQEADTGNR